jgi:hypothetical protein
MGAGSVISSATYRYVDGPVDVEVDTLDGDLDVIDGQTAIKTNGSNVRWKEDVVREEKREFQQ